MLKIGIIGVCQNYYNAVKAAGGEPVTIMKMEDVEMIRDLDGLLVPGGIDVDPSYYHEENTGCGPTDKELDALEFAAIKAAVEDKKPILGICRGLQLINVFFHGTLIQHVDQWERHVRDERKRDRAHDSIAEKDSFLYEIYGREHVRTNSSHHQAVKDLGEGLKVGSYSDDGLVESIYHTTLPIIAVQWHPERMCLIHKRDDTEDGLLIFEYFLKKCEAAKAV